MVIILCEISSLSCIGLSLISTFDPKVTRSNPLCVRDIDFYLYPYLNNSGHNIIVVFTKLCLYVMV